MDVPAPVIVIVFPLMVATAVLELLYEKSAGLLEDGSVIAKDASPKVFVGTVKLVMVDVDIIIVDPVGNTLAKLLLI